MTTELRPFAEDSHEDFRWFSNSCNLDSMQIFDLLCWLVLAGCDSAESHVRPTYLFRIR